jgi:hypothetical protein
MFDVTRHRELSPIQVVLTQVAIDVADDSAQYKDFGDLVEKQLKQRYHDSSEDSAREMYLAAADEEFHRYLIKDLSDRGIDPGDANAIVLAIISSALNFYSETVCHIIASQLEKALDTVNRDALHEVVQKAERELSALVQTAPTSITGGGPVVLNMSSILAEGLPDFLCFYVSAKGVDGKPLISGWPARGLIYIDYVTRATKYLLSLFDSVPAASVEQIAQDKSCYGAKGAYHLALKKAVAELDEVFARAGINVRFPDFTLLPARISSQERETLARDVDG